jgi:heme exporter protein CcmD
MSGPFALYVWIAYSVSLAGLAATIAVTFAAYRRAKRAVKDSETKP